MNSPEIKQQRLATASIVHGERTDDAFLARERNDERIARSLRDSIATGQMRLDNYKKAESNAEP